MKIDPDSCIFTPMFMYRIGILWLVLVLASCSVTKRHYRSGFYISHQHRVNANVRSDSNAVESKFVQRFFPATNKEERICNNVSENTTLQIISTQSIPVRSVALSENKLIWIKTIEKALPNLFYSEVQLKKLVPTSIEQNEKTQELANQYANTALKSAIWALILSWTIIGGFIFGVRAVNKAKLATMLSDGNYPEIDIKANRAILLAQILFISYTVILLLTIIIAFLRLA